MPSIHGEFANKAAAQKAVDALIAAGVSRQHFRLWNIIPHNENASRADNVERGALFGGVLGGTAGFVAGAAIGGALDTDSGDGKSLPSPSGVRLVVDTGPNSPDVASLLQGAGAANVHSVDY